MSSSSFRWKFEFFVTSCRAQALGLKIKLTRRPLSPHQTVVWRGPRIFSILGGAEPALRQGFAFGKTLGRATGAAR